MVAKNYPPLCRQEDCWHQRSFSRRGRPLEFRSSSLCHSTFSPFSACGVITIISGWWRTATLKHLTNFTGTDWRLYVAVCFHSITTYAKNCWHVLHILSLSTYWTGEQHRPYGIVWNVAEQWRMLFTFQLHCKKRMETCACPSPLLTTGKGGGKSCL